MHPQQQQQQHSRMLKVLKAAVLQTEGVRSRQVIQQLRDQQIRNQQSMKYGLLFNHQLHKMQYYPIYLELTRRRVTKLRMRRDGNYLQEIVNLEGLDSVVY